MTDEIKTNFENVFKTLFKNKKIIFPTEDISKNWTKVLNEWIDDDQMILFVRKGGETRGQIFETSCGRKIMTTDNTPAHWVFKNIVLNGLNHSKKEISELIKTNNFPISFIRKKSEKETLIGKMVADKETRLNNDNWKLAHIGRIAMKRGKSITVNDYKDHHRKFLDLTNIYLIHRDFSGLAETPMFNEIVKEYLQKKALPTT